MKKGDWYYHHDVNGGLTPCKIACTNLDDNNLKAKFGIFCFWWTFTIRQDDLRHKLYFRPWWCWF